MKQYLKPALQYSKVEEMEYIAVNIESLEPGGTPSLGDDEF